MRAMLFLLIGMGAALALGFLLVHGSAPESSTAESTQVDPTDWTLIVTALLLSWGSAWLPLPRWIGIPLSFGVIGFGILFAIMGGLSAYADSYLKPAQTAGWAMCCCGLAMIASRVPAFWRWFRKLTLDEFTP